MRARPPSAPPHERLARGCGGDLASLGEVAARRRHLRDLARGGRLAATLALLVVVQHYEAGLPNVSELKVYQPPQVTRVLARDGSVLAELYTQRRTVVPLAALPAHVKLAVLAAEDAGFYEHEGLNYLGIARAFLVNLRSRTTRQGGSTITQQVVKNVLLETQERTFSRKIREALLARRLEQELSKDEILEIYLNHIYFGRGRYGVEEAARDDFGKSAKDVTIAEAALIAGRIANPHEYSPRSSMTLALSRRAYVLGQMHGKGFLTDDAWKAADAEPVRLAPPVQASSELAPEAVEIARSMLDRLEPAQARLGGFTIATTIDPALQAAARKAVREALGAYDKRHGLQGPLRKPPPWPIGRASRRLRETASWPSRGTRSSSSTGCSSGPWPPSTTPPVPSTCASAARSVWSRSPTTRGTTSTIIRRASSLPSAPACA